LDETEIFNMYRENQEIYQKDEFSMSCTDGIVDTNVDLATVSGLQKFVDNLVAFMLSPKGSSFIAVL